MYPCRTLISLPKTGQCKQNTFYTPSKFYVNDLKQHYANPKRKASFEIYYYANFKHH